MSIGELWAAKLANWRFQWRTIRHYYPKSWRFALCDLALGFSSLFFNPYRVCRKNGYVYGETPIESLHRIAALCSLSSDDCWLELGSGRGKGAFWIANFIGCKTIGVEKIPLFFRISNAIRVALRMKRLSFICADLADSDFAKATCVYLYSTCMDNGVIASLTEKMQALPMGAKVVTVSAPLPESNAFRHAGAFPISFPWGETDGYLHERIDNGKTEQ